MVQLKAHEVARYLDKPQLAHRIFLFYGSDIGLVSENANRLAKASGANLDDPFSTIKIDADTAAADPQRVADEAYTVSMFGGDRLVWIRGNTQRNLAAALQPVIVDPSENCIVLIEAGNLKKSNPLLSRIEKADTALALPCYSDQVHSMSGIIDEHLKSAKISIASDARQLLLTLIGSDRLASRAELQKLCLYASGSESISVSDVAEVVGDASSFDVDMAIDAASIGDIATMEHMLKRLFSRGATTFMVLSAAQRHFQMLHQLRCQTRHGSQTSTGSVGAFRPPVHFQRKEKVALALSIWSAAAMEKLLERLETVSLESRTKASLAIPLVSTAFLAIAIEASRNRYS